MTKRPISAGGLASAKHGELHSQPASVNNVPHNYVTVFGVPHEKVTPPSTDALQYANVGRLRSENWIWRRCYVSPRLCRGRVVGETGNTGAIGGVCEMRLNVVTDARSHWEGLKHQSRAEAEEKELMKLPQHPSLDSFFFFLLTSIAGVIYVAPAKACGRL